MSDEGTVENVSTETVETVVDDSANTVETPKEEPKVFDADYVKQLREEAARHRVEKQKEREEKETLLAKIKEFEDAKLSEQEKLTRDYDSAKDLAQRFEAKAREANLELQIALAARDEKITDVKAAVKLADRELIEYDDNGQVTNLSEVLESLKSTYSSLFSAAPSGGPSVTPTNPAKVAKTKQYTREDLKLMSPERITELSEKGELNHLLGRR